KILDHLIAILKGDPKKMKKIIKPNAAITLARLAYVFPEDVLKFWDKFAVEWMNALTEFPEDQDKLMAFQTLVGMITANPKVVVSHNLGLVALFRAICSWRNPPQTLQTSFAKVLLITSHFCCLCLYAVEFLNAKKKKKTTTTKKLHFMYSTSTNEQRTGKTNSRKKEEAFSESGERVVNRPTLHRIFLVCPRFDYFPFQIFAPSFFLTFWVMFLFMARKDTIRIIFYAIDLLMQYSIAIKIVFDGYIFLKKKPKKKMAVPIVRFCFSLLFQLFDLDITLDLQISMPHQEITEDIYWEKYVKAKNASATAHLRLENILVDRLLMEGEEETKVSAESVESYYFFNETLQLNKKSITLLFQKKKK
ncbi:hypothetical protein RFI_14786, partial [Reticulomyxa filosa]